MLSVKRFGRTSKPVVQRGVHFVRLDRLPHNVQLPEQLADQIWFDDNRKQLAFRGFMSKATFDRLHALSIDNAYQRAMEELFRQSVYEEPPSGEHFLRRLLPLAAFLVLFIVALAVAIPLRLLPLP